MSQLPLKIAIGTAPHTADLKNGTVPIDGVAADFVEVTPIIGAFRRMVRSLEFDVCEMAPTTYMIAREHGSPFTALPIFLHRFFHHDGILCRDGSGIRSPADLAGRKVGVRAFTVTTGVWKRGIMKDDYGLDASGVTWVVDDEEAVPGLTLPPNVVRDPAGRSLVAQWQAGDLDAAFTGAAGIGRQGAPDANWSQGANPPQPVAAHDLFDHGFDRASDFYRRTRIYPHHGLLVVKDSILAEHPWVARSLFDAALAAKAPFLAQVDTPEGGDAEIQRYRQLATVVGSDPLPYGVDANRPSIDALIDYAADQGLLKRKPDVSDLFVTLN
ncbi:ABC transporter substrate-binding protein [Sphingomonas oryzagri]|uniref:ABC transporter substrate-binding protein n=1 Tax=Sphingomonas oryzagri TaxID=3042314 RepID=A0ABT6MXG2_9SPHN|nr:ABC transporter substrate-binding protein [Sphingomonas oryzagri]MDH7637734.1 ABC transporter substrate-binding protein [Sphingomonas oryzagri]